MENQYIPGACNIGPAEIGLRRVFGWIALAACLALWAVLTVSEVPPIWRLTLFVPAMLAALGFLQAKRRFCVVFGLRGEFNVGPSTGKTMPVEQADSRRQDRKLATWIIGLSLLVGIFIAGVAYSIPL